MTTSRILIIMEQHDEDRYLRDLLTLAGYDVLLAHDGKTGIAMAQTEKPDAILCEVFMSEMDGFSVLVVLSKQLETASIPFVFFAHTYHKADIRKGMELGADDYLSRPFSDVQLLNSLAVRLQKRENQLEYFKNTYRIDQNKSLYQQGKLALELLKDQSIQRKIKKKQILFYEGDKVVGIYYVRKGAIKVTKIAQDGRELTVRIHSTGDYIGLHNLYNEQTHTDNAEAMSDCEISILPIQEFEKLIEHHPEMAGKFIHMLSQESSKTEEHLIHIAYDSVRKRIANSLISYFNTYCPNGESIHLSRNELANISGTTPETVSRTLTDFEQEGLIRKDQNRIIIVQADKLHYLKN